jgi:hypothetical protein
MKLLKQTKRTLLVLSYLLLVAYYFHNNTNIQNSAFAKYVSDMQISK